MVAYPFTQESEEACSRSLSAASLRELDATSGPDPGAPDACVSDEELIAALEEEAAEQDKIPAATAALFLREAVVRLRDARARLAAIAEREAAVCPEDVPFDEFIRSIVRALDAARAQLAAREAECAVLNEALVRAHFVIVEVAMEADDSPDLDLAVVEIGQLLANTAEAARAYRENIEEPLRARIAAAWAALDGVRQWMLTIRPNSPPPAFQPSPMMDFLADTAAAAREHDDRVRAEATAALEHAADGLDGLYFQDDEGTFVKLKHGDLLRWLRDDARALAAAPAGGTG